MGPAHLDTSAAAAAGQMMVNNNNNNNVPRLYQTAEMKIGFSIEGTEGVV